jgi:hypothetical protein
MHAVADEHVVDASRRRERVVAVRGARVFVFVRAMSVREPVELEMVDAIARAMRSSTTASSGSGARPPRTNAGTHWSVTSTRMPSAPSDSATAGASGFVLFVDGEQLSIRRDERRRDDLGRDAADRAGAVGAGRDRAEID